MSVEFITLVEREETPLWVTLVIEGCADRDVFLKTNGVDFALQHYRFIGRIHQIGAEDLSSLAGSLKKKIMEDGPSYFHWYEIKCREYCERLIETAERLAEAHIQASYEQAGNGLLEYLATAYTCMPYLVSIFPVQSLLSEHISQAIEPHLHDLDLTVDSALSLLSKPAEPTAIEKDSQDLSKIVDKVIADDSLRKILGMDNAEEKLAREHPTFMTELQEHCMKYGWLRTFTYRNRPYGVSILIKRLADRVWRYEQAEPNIDHLGSKDATVMKELGIVEARLDGKGKLFLELARRYATLRFYRVDVHFMTAAIMADIFATVAKHLDLPFELLAYLTRREISVALGGEEADWNKRATARKDNGFDAILNEDGKAIITTPTSMKAEPLRDTPGLEGTSACLGKASGQVRIVRSSHDCIHFDRGDVLVSPMTTPEFMSAIERASAIVTDEGGLLCHAAIISRELNIPCVIGTEIASHVLQTGELITVDAKPEIGLIHRDDY